MVKYLARLIIISMFVLIQLNSIIVFAEDNLNEDDRFLINQQLDIFSQSFVEEDKDKMSSVINEYITVISKDKPEEYSRNSLLNMYYDDWGKYDMTYFRIVDRAFSVEENIVTVNGSLEIGFSNGDTVVESVVIDLIKNDNLWLINKLD